MTAMELMESVGRTEETLIEPVLTPAAKKKLSRPLRTALILAAVLALLALLGSWSRVAAASRMFPQARWASSRISAKKSASVIWSRLGKRPVFS